MLRTLTRALVCALALATLGCGDADTSAEPPITDTERQELAEAMAATAVHDDGGEIGAMADSVLVLDGLGMPALDLEAEGRFVGRKGSFEFAFDVDCFNEDDQPVACGPLAQRADIEASWSARVELPRRTTDASYAGRWTIERMSGARYRLDGTGSMRLDSAFASASDKNQKTVDLAWDANYEGLIIDREQQRAPIDGHVVYALNVERTHDTPGRERTEVIELDAVLSFEGETATLLIDDEERYRVDVHADGHARIKD